MDKNIVILKGNIITESGVSNTSLCFEEGIITAVGDVQPKGEVIDLGQSYVVPGFIDLHTHGIHYSLIDDGPDELAKMCRILPQYGVTGFLPTVAPRPKGKDAVFLSTLSQAKTDGSQILGFHLEGPFLKITGSLTAGAISEADVQRVNDLIEAAKPYRTIFSISPDVPDIENLLPTMTTNAPAFITHTAANVEQTQKAISLGAKHATHFYDVFPCPEVKDPGVRPCGAVEAILADPGVSVDFILDGVHVNPIAVKMAMACKSKGRGCVCLITDSNVGAGLGVGRFVFGDSGEIEFAYPGSPARLVKDNVLAGSGLTMDQALRNAMRWLDVNLPEAVAMVSTNPAKVLGIDNKKGKLKPGYDADFVILDERLNVNQTWIAGKCQYKKQ